MYTSNNDSAGKHDNHRTILPVNFICENGHLFNYPAMGYHPAGECHGVVCSEPIPECPECGGEYEKVRMCSQCDTYIGESQARFNLCPDCEIDAEKRFEDMLLANFTKAELEYLNNQYQGEYFGI